MLWRLGYAAVIRALATLLRIASADAVYLRGSFATGEPIYGLSDVDLVAVVGAERHEVCRLPLRGRVARFYERMPAARGAVEVTVLAETELRQALLSPGTTFPLDPGTLTAIPQARFHGGRSLQEAHGPRAEGGWRLYGSARRWRHLAGRDPIAALPDSPDAYRWLWAWLELQFIWKHTFRVCADPTSEHAAYFCTKMISWPSRLWLWISSGKRPIGRDVEMLEEALRAMPEEAPTLRLARSMRCSLGPDREAPVNMSLPFLWRVSSWIARLLAEEAVRAGTTKVSLLGEDHDPRLPEPGRGAERSLAGGRAIPLVDWRARQVPGPPDEEFVLLAGRPSDPQRLGSVALAAGESPYPALRSEDLLVFPTARRGSRPLSAAAFRSVQSPVTDPVSFALLDNERSAAFPHLPGWSVGESAARGVIEHRAWLDVEGGSAPSRHRRLAMLFSAARSAIFAQSAEAGEPTLPLTPAATVAGIASIEPRGRTAAEVALERYEESRATGAEPPAPALAAFERLVRRLLSRSLVEHPGSVPASERGIAGHRQ